MKIKKLLFLERVEVPPWKDGVCPNPCFQSYGQTS